MNITKKRGIALLATTAILAGAGSLVASPAFAATSAAPVYLVDYDAGGVLTDPIDWTLSSIGISTIPDAVNQYSTGFVIPAGTQNEQAFISNIGSEDNIAGWLGSEASSGTVTSEATPASLHDNPNVAGDFHTLLAAGGSFSLGVAFVGAGNTYLSGYFTTINIAAGSPNLTYTAPVSSSVAPVVTTQPASSSAVAGSNATFTAAASGTPTPTVQWQSAPSASSTFTDVAGATSATLSVTNVGAAQSGNQYRAVFTNSAGSATSNVAVLTVTAALPTQPTGAGSAGTATVAQGAHSFVFTFPAAVAAGTYDTWGWSAATQLPNTVVAADHSATIDVTGLPAGAHTIGIYTPNTTNMVSWLTITIPQPLNTSVVNLSVDVTTTNKFALEGVASAVDLGSTARGGTTSADLPAFTVTDDRDSLPGWDLTSNVADFVNDGVAVPANLGDVIGKSALTVDARKVGPDVTGITATGSYAASASNEFAQGLANSSTASTGTQFDAKLTFAAPATAKKGTYKSTLTLTLTSK